MHKSTLVYGLATLVTVGLFACAEAESYDSPAGSSSGGASGSGGSATGGQGSGGVNTTGGATATGGATTSGGTTATGGATASGGAGTGGTGGATAAAGSCSITIEEALAQQMGSAGGAGGMGGFGGDAGAGGVAGSGGADPVPTLALHGYVKMGSAQTDAEPGAEIEVKNQSGQAIPLSTLRVRYYIASEFSAVQTEGYQVNVSHFQREGSSYASIGPTKVTTNVVAGLGGDGKLAYFEFSFAADAGDLPAGDAAVFGFWSQLNIYDGTVRDQTNDYSWGACGSKTVPWVAVTIWQDSTLAWGIEPAG
jgi:hypothetical protein